MSPHSFLTVPVELLEHAEAAAKYFADRAYKVKAEHFEVSFPERPTLVCTRKQTTLIVEVHKRVPVARIEAWVRYALSCSKDTQIAICLPNDAKLTAKEQQALQELKIGCYETSVDGVVERKAPVDLALHVALPDASTLPHKVRRLLGPVYDQFDRHQWREGFRDACQILEQQACHYLKKGIHSTRIVVLDQNGNPRNPTDHQIDKMTLGALAIAFQNIQTPNQSDDMIGKALNQINPDRVGIVHHNDKSITEKRLRTNVGNHMWCIVSGLKATTQ